MGITEEAYDKFYQSFRDKIANLDARLSMLQEVKDNYYITGYIPSGTGKTSLSAIHKFESKKNGS